MLVAAGSFYKIRDEMSHRSFATLREDIVPSPYQEPVHVSTTPTNWGRKRRFSRVDTTPHGMENLPLSVDHCWAKAQGASDTLGRYVPIPGI